MPAHQHRAGALRQSNKRNKRSKSSKRSITRAAGGRVNSSGGSVKGGAAAVMLLQSKADRKNQLKQRRDIKRQEMMRKRRGMDGVSSAPPRVVGIVSLGPNDKVEECLRDFIIVDSNHTVRPFEDGQESTVTCRFDGHKKEGNLTILTSRTAFNNNRQSHSEFKSDDDAVLAALDLARVCDILLIVIDGNTPRIEGNIREIHVGTNSGGADDRSTHTGKSTIGQNWDHLISERGDRILAALKAQGLPTPLTVLAQTEKEEFGEDHMTTQSMKSFHRSSVKRKLELKKYVNRFATTELGSDLNKVVEVDLTMLQEDDEMDEDAAREKRVASATLVRTLCTMACSPPKWVAKSARPYVLSDSYNYHEDTHELQVKGYIRGMAPFDCSSLVHIPNFGTFACKSVAKAVEPLCPPHKVKDMADDDIIFANPEQQESLSMFAPRDALEGEQNLVGFDEVDAQGSQENNEAENKFARPAGWSDYQAAWLDAVGEDGVDEDEDAIDHGELAAELNKKESSTVAKSVAPDDAMDLDEANDVTAEERRVLVEQRRKEQTENDDFPDEVQVDEDMNARDRFARYRALKNFRKSFWDPKESLPESYGSVYNFPSFKATQRAVMNEMKAVASAAEKVKGQFWGKSPPEEKEEGGEAEMEDDQDDDSSEEGDILLGFIPTGSYVTLTLLDVPPEQFKLLSATALLTAVALLPHENKVSVLHMGVCQTPSCDQTDKVPVKSKDILTIRCGWRTWKARPVFSQNNLNCDKHKFERYLPRGGAFFAASCFGPVTYTPCPAMLFREASADDETAENSDDLSKHIQRRELVALGGMIGADADRIVVKRIVLTGYPVRVHKRYATVKYMFYNPEDVKWFKPAGLVTKHGLQGNIVDSIGEHGTMKCLFNANIKQHDTVCIPLYKRIYPKMVTTGKKSSSDTTTYKEANTLIVR